MELWRHRPCWDAVVKQCEAGAASGCHHQAVLASAAAGVEESVPEKMRPWDPHYQQSSVSGDCSLEEPSGSLSRPGSPWGWKEQVVGREGPSLCGHHQPYLAEEGAVGIPRDVRGWLPPFLVSQCGVLLWGLPHTFESFPPPSPLPSASPHSKTPYSDPLPPRRASLGFTPFSSKNGPNHLYPPPPL